MTAKQRAARAKFKAVVAEAKKLRKKNPKLTQAQAVKQAFAISYSKAGKSKVGAVKKKAAPKKKAATKVKAKKSKGTEMHTDTKSHNVNIRVISGIENVTSDILFKYAKTVQDIEGLEKALNRNKETLKKPQYKTPFWKKYIGDTNKKIVKTLAELKKHKAELKKLI